jgi:hypothetical protein
VLHKNRFHTIIVSPSSANWQGRAN